MIKARSSSFHLPDLIIPVHLFLIVRPVAPKRERGGSSGGSLSRLELSGPSVGGLRGPGAMTQGTIGRSRQKPPRNTRHILLASLEIDRPPPVSRGRRPTQGACSSPPGPLSRPARQRRPRGGGRSSPGGRTRESVAILEASGPARRPAWACPLACGGRGGRERQPRAGAETGAPGWGPPRPGDPASCRCWGRTLAIYSWLRLRDG